MLIFFPICGWKDLPRKWYMHSSRARPRLESQSLYFTAVCVSKGSWTLWTLTFPSIEWASLVAQMVKNLPAMQETWVWSLGPGDPLEKGMAPHSSILAWRISWIEESGGLLSTGLQRGGHDWANKTSIKWGQADLLQRLNSVIYETARYRRCSADAHSYCRRDNFASLVVFLFQALTREFTLPGEKRRFSRLFLLWGKKICLRQFSFYIFFCSGLFYLTAV